MDFKDLKMRSPPRMRPFASGTLTTPFQMGIAADG